MSNRRKRAVIIKIAPSHIVRDVVTNKLYETGNYVDVLDERGGYHQFVNGAINQIVNPVVGKSGYIEFHSNGRSGLWYFHEE